MATQTVETVNRLAPYLEGLEKRPINVWEFDSSGEQTTQGLIDTPIDLPDYQIAPLDPMQQAAANQALQQFGMFQPYVQSAGQLSAKGIAQGLQMLDPTVGIQSYMNPYQGAVLDEINRQAAIGQKRLSDQAVQSGAFGGSNYKYSGR